MCGITGILSYDSKEPVDREFLRRACATISHRGPDDEGFYFDDEAGVGLGHRRLSIIDLASGNQPMTTSDETVWIVFNGEIYNFPQLKSELQKKGCCFRTTSDTEVILYLYQQYGIKGFSRLNGIFAFAIYDKREKKIILARDHFGVKPLYYFLSGEKLVFGSEIKALLQDASVPRDIDYESFNTFLTFRYNPSPQTLFKGIKKLHPGHYLSVGSDGKAELASFWEYAPSTDTAITEEEAVSQYQILVEKAIERQMISDVPIGVLLSGGLDSAIVATLMSGYSERKVKSFSIGFPGKGDYNELADARATASYAGTEHYEMTITQQQYLDFFYDSFFYTEEPIAETTIPALYYVSRLASQHLKVVLAGQGADEPLAGYKRYFGENIIGKYSSLLRLLPLDLIAKVLPRNERFKRAVFASQFTNEPDRFLAIYTIFTPVQISDLLNDDAKRSLKDVNRAFVEKLYEETRGLSDSLSRLLYIDTRMSLSDNLLIFGDKMSMANSLEMRVPFLDVELVKFIESLPGEMKLRGFTHKYIHKQAARKWLPSKIINRKKRGFATPMDQWLQSDLAEKAKEIINDKNSASRNYFNLPYINRMIELHERRKENYQRHIFALLSFEVWHKRFFDSESLELAR